MAIHVRFSKQNPPLLLPPPALPHLQLHLIDKHPMRGGDGSVKVLDSLDGDSLNVITAISDRFSSATVSKSYPHLMSARRPIVNDREL